MTDQRKIMAATDRLAYILNKIAAMEIILPDLDAWDATDLAEIETIINGELQRRHDETRDRVYN